MQKIINDRARFVPNFQDFLKWRIAGSVHVDPNDFETTPAGKVVEFWYCCPCGCGDVGPLECGIGFKPEGKPTWRWNGSTEQPDLSPSIHHLHHWHGYLDNGGRWRLA